MFEKCINVCVEALSHRIMMNRNAIITICIEICKFHPLIGHSLAQQEIRSRQPCVKEMCIVS